MTNNKDQFFAFSISLLVLVLISVPFIIAGQSEGAEVEFAGFLFNPLDGNSYLAKMYQGWSGSWRFQLPFTADPGEGAYLFLFYLTLGQISRLLNLPLLLVFHLARILSAWVLLRSLWLFFSAILETPRARNLAFALAALGSGMGWLLIPLGAFTADFWVAEAYPFLSMYANPHFPLGLALVLGLVTPPLDRQPDWKTALRWAVAAFVLSVINPFGVVISLMILGGTLLWKLVRNVWVKSLLQRLAVIAAGGLPVLFYDFWIANTGPAFSNWNAQNMTPSPPLGDVLVALSPALILAIFGAIFIQQVQGLQNETNPAMLLVLWSGPGLLFLYIPISLQRRFMMGLLVPLAGLAALGIEYLAKKNPQRYKTYATLLFLLAIPTNLIVLLAVFSGIQSQESQIYLTRSESQALIWVVENTKADDLILASPEMGLFIPAHTGRRVIYGHPFETVNAEAEKQVVEAFYKGEEAASHFLLTRGIDYVMWGPRERELGNFTPIAGLELVFSRDDVFIYQVGEP